MWTADQWKRGIFNRYRKDMPFAKRVLEDVRFLFQRARAQKAQNEHLLFLPHYPSKKACLHRIGLQQDILMSNRRQAQAPDWVVYWEYRTHRKNYDHLLADFPQSRILNYHSTNIGKCFVDDAVRAIFGYATQIDPSTHQGAAVQKSDDNAIHDGQIIDCPIKEKQAGFIYQKLLDNQVDERWYEDIRIPIIGQQIPHVYLKFNTIDKRFESADQKATMHATDEIMSSEEQTLTIQLCQRLGLDWGELDAIRDRQDGRLYIIDINNTPNGPPNELDPALRQKAIEVMAQCFRNEFPPLSAPSA